MKNTYLSLLIFSLIILIIFLIINYISVINYSEIIKISNTGEIKYELFRDLLTLLLTFFGIIAAGAYFYLKKDLDDKIDKSTKTIKTISICVQGLYECVQKEKYYGKNIENLLQSQSIYHIEPWLQSLISKARKIVIKTEELDEEKYKGYICTAKNNLAYYLSIARINKEGAQDLMDYVCKNMGGFPNQWYHWKDTYVWFNWCFAKNENERNKAKEIFYELYKQKETISDIEFKIKLERYKNFFDRS